MYYKSIQIDGFRGLKQLRMEDLRRVNLLVGKNSCGKTSILEAFFLLSGMSNPQLPINIHNFRDLILTSDDDFSFMFSNLDFSVPSTISGVLSNERRTLSLSPIYSNGLQNVAQQPIPD